MWKSREKNIRLALLGNSSFLENAEETGIDIVKDVLSSGDEEMLLTLIRNMESLGYLVQTFRGLAGLSGRGRRLLSFLKHHHLKSVRREYARLYWLPKELSIDFNEARRDGIQLIELPLENMRAVDAQIINLDDRDECHYLASSLEIIMSRETRRIVVLKLARHRDPEIRILLSENRATPHTILEFMCEAENEDTDFAISARRALFKKRRKKIK